MKIDVVFHHFIRVEIGVLPRRFVLSRELMDHHVRHVLSFDPLQFHPQKEAFLIFV